MKPRLASPGRIERFEELKRDEGMVDEVFRQLCEDRAKSLRQLAREWGLPRGAFVRWFAEEHAGLYEAVLRVRADDLAHEALELADTATKGRLGKARLQVETRLRLASKWDRERYGEGRDGPVVSVTVSSEDQLREKLERLVPDGEAREALVSALEESAGA